MKEIEKWKRPNILIPDGAETVELTEKQRNKAQKLLEKISEMESPKDLVNEWKVLLRGFHNNFQSSFTEKKMIDPRKVIGTCPGQGMKTYLRPTRLKKVLVWLVKGFFMKRYEYPPDLIEIDGSYYIAKGGTHRTLAHKVLNLKEMYAEVHHYQGKDEG